MAEKKHKHLIVTDVKEGIALPPFRGDDFDEASYTHVAWLDSEVVKNAFYLECVWYWPHSGKDLRIVEAHAHPFDEVIAFFGTNFDDPTDLGGEIEVWLEDEQYILKKSCVIFVPREMKHSPLIWRRIDRPIFHFTVGPGGEYS